MHIDQRKEQFSRAYVKALAAVTGFAWSVPSVDDDSVDLILSKKGGNGTCLSPRLEPQLKCTSDPAPTEPEFSFSLKMKNYNELRLKRVMVPRILVVVFVPTELNDWLKHSETELAMRRCAYWFSLRGMPVSTNAISQTVRMQKSQTFNVDSLDQIMQRISEGGLP
jgi:hypothetical protein